MRLTQLEVLDLEQSAVTDAGLAHLKGLANLSELYLGSEFNRAGPRITDAGLPHLSAS